MEEIHDDAFLRCVNFKNIKIPKNLKHIGKNAFTGCNLENIDFNEAKELEVLDNKCFSENNIETINLEECLYLENIGDNCFKDCSRLKNVILPESFEKLGSKIFKNCSLDLLIFQV